MVFSIMFGLFGVVLAILCARDMNFSFRFTRNAADISMTDDFQFADQLLSYHNWFRNQHSADALTWNASMAATAEQWASNCAFKHSVSNLDC